ncbi:MAG: 50S ribosomal protein L17 [Candidatus Taylorbacteria bacterium RIFCSPLOWO2_02_FULL_43_11]|uniref:50S ribosomal protein L17 n=1 Tax=Candidatus Taylorbacteria bacterium RIFCSPHIGHO2_02_FULL_43_32b TaxID=1802306 RepID=A0A1G2MEX5_9BACT|nr:MAG: 50S ribosomal protein L17 [Candidatus Taylorbacteria bacterium RIFCSPHIGHO2_01_FULL_43_47]OHA22254.1 MAG: 50S ribosomal protein L17 [Candidatus Taylorbacteria bacterium RIFCSPHIGHO2_02_FULL_43_32b]OHA29611.1 MAG: 50S ribosomal protein L17 [Candidatus Taylorbacteria bacterium RIFCSPLOWO2_01_FULL_43_44]OHA36139.1 MAG: 50S ribosomal protein L17 [Candidatus Taylorbacteria bacterium RIFCSPLOWO2_02_FULL_43_11]
MRSKSARKFGRVRKVRRALNRSLVLALLEKGAITTTLAKAKETRPGAEKIITLGKKGTLSSKRLIASRISPLIVKKVCGDIAEKYKSRNGGYSRIIKLGFRKSDGAEMARIMLV